MVRASAALIYDHAALSAINFIEDQSSYIFSGSNSFSANASTPEQLFAISPRFTNADSAAVNIPIPPFQKTVTPFTGNQCPSGFPVCGTLFNQFGNYVIDPHYKTPYSLAYSLGIQRALPAGFQLEADYVLRLGRRLGALADAGQIFNFVDPASKQSLASAVNALEIDARNNVPVAQVQAQPFFENQLAAAGANCSGFANCTQFVYGGSGNFTSLQQGNLNGVIRSLAQAANLPPNVGFTSQFVSNYYLSNKSYSDYNGLIVILRKRLSQGVQMDLNYTFSHSIDNFSGISNNNGNPFNNAQSVLCDAVNLGTCKGNSEFDVTHQISSDVIYDLPFGRGKAFARNSSRWLDEIIGGWQASGIVTWRSGLALTANGGGSTTSLAADQGVFFTGSQAAVATSLHTDTANNNQIQFFANPQRDRQREHAGDAAHVRPRPRNRRRDIHAPCDRA